MKTIGIDISKLTFDVFSEELGHEQFSNDKEGFKAFKKTLNKQDHCVMEATGCYHFLLANYLYEKGFKVSVENPLVVKRFIQMKQQKVKTDKHDAKMIALYGVEQKPKLWEPEPPFIEEGKLVTTLIQMYVKQQTQLKNKLDNLRSGGIEKGIMIQSLNLQLKRVKVEIKKLETDLENLLKEHSPEVMTNIRSIPGIGKKTAMLLMVTTNNFRDFTSSKQVTSYVGLAPVERSSGSSIRGRSYISKKGDPMLRHHLFMCSFTACQNNPQCKALYERIVAKGKSKKLALIAVCNKLIKQAYGVCKNDLVYDENYKKRKVEL
ncbi:MAG: IS110 family transposase [Crocinitomicaceae bacterium]|nr:IS110 family transposase [Crocinitomicaceae bacterium]